MKAKHILIGVGAFLVLRYIYKKNKTSEPFVISERNSNAIGSVQGCNPPCSKGKMCSKGFCIGSR